MLALRRRWPRRRCESGFDRNDQIVNSLRILGVKAHVITNDANDQLNWADADAGDTVEFSALVANPTGDPALTVTWLACLPVPGQVSPCTYPPDLRDPTKIVPDPSTGVSSCSAPGPTSNTPSPTMT